MTRIGFLHAARGAPQGPVSVVTMDDELARTVQHWARVSMGPCVLLSSTAGDGTLLLRTGGTWDSIIAVADAARAGALPSAEAAVIGGGVRDAKILAPGHELTALHGAEVLDLCIG